MNTSSSTSVDGPTVVLLFGNWSAFTEALNSFFAEYKDYMQKVDHHQYHLVTILSEVHQFFQSGTVPKNWHIMCSQPIGSFGLLGSFPQAMLMSGHTTTKMIAFTAELTEKEQCELINAGYHKIINVTQKELNDPATLFRRVFNDVFVLEPLK